VPSCCLLFGLRIHFFFESLEDLSLVCFLLENQGPTIEKTASILSETMTENHVADLLY